MEILYIEDEPNDANLVALYVKSTQHNLHLAANTREAKAALQQSPDLILVDVVLGQAREGYQFARELREQGYNRPMVAVTGLSTPKDQEDCRDSGFDEVLTKPFTISQLANVINKYAS